MFEPVTLTWDGKDYEVAPDRVMKVIAAIEEHVTLAELASPRTLRMTAVAAGYHAALRQAGVRNVATEDVYRALFRRRRGQVGIQEAVAGLLSIMVPPTAAGEDEEDDEGNGEGTDGAPATSSSAAPTKRSSSSNG